MKGREVNNTFIKNVRKQLQDDEEVVITVAAEKKLESAKAILQKLSDLEKKYPPKNVPQDFDFNAIIDSEINL